MNLCRNSDERGFALVSLVIAMPVLLALIALFLHRWGELRDSKIQRSACRSELARGLDGAGRQIQNLLDLNIPVREAKVEMIAAQAALAAAVAMMNPAAVSAARAWIAKVQARQRLLRGRQLLLLARGQMDLQAAVARAMNAIGEIPEGRLSVGLSRRKVRGLRGRPVGLAVRTRDEKSGYPEYELKPDFERLQSLELNWQSHFRTPSKENAWSFRDARIPESCGMTLKPLTRGFRPVPSQGRYFWKR